MESSSKVEIDMSRDEERVCPRCGSRYSWLERKAIHGRIYVYAVHEWREGGRRRRKWCLLGPEDKYIHASTTHEAYGLVLRGAIDSSRLYNYLDTITSYLLQHHKTLDIDRHRAQILAQKLEKLAELLKQTP